MIALSIFVLIFLGLSQSAGLVAGRLLAVIRPLAPWQRSWTLLFYATAPLLLAGIVTAAVFVPQFAGLVIDMHCHDGMCGQHAPASLLAFPLALLLLVAVLGPFAAVALLGTVAAWRAARFGTVLAQLARPDSDSSFRVLESSEPFAVSTGLVRRRVLVSSALLDAVTPEQLRVVTLHEQAHAWRFDNLRSLAAAMVTVLWPRGARRQLLAELSLTAEQACDQAVSQTLGPRLVADTIMMLRQRQLERRRGTADEPGSGRREGGAGHDHPRGARTSSFIGLDPTTAARLQALEEPRWRGLPPRSLALAAVLAALQVVLLSQLVHHGLEAVLR